jgi:integrase
MVRKTERSTRPKKRGLSLSLLERGRYHVIVRQMVRENGSTQKRPVLWVVLPDANGLLRLKVYEPLLDYFAEHSTMSYTWMKNAARGIGALIDHSLALGSSPLFDRWKEDGVVERRLLRGFASALVHGTMEVAPNGRIVDQTRLYWGPLGKRQASVLLSALTLHFRWMGDEPEAIRWVQAASTDVVAQSPRAALSLVSELMIRKHNSLLGHLKGLRREPSHAFPGVVERSRKGAGAVPSFPTKYVTPFLYTGFTDKAGECDEAGQLIAHLIFALGLRKSEPFHLYTSDLQFIGNDPWVFFHHPEYGKVAGADGRYISREEYLQQFELLPRNRDRGRNEAGWKGMADDEQGTPGYFLPIRTLRQRTARLLLQYICVTRPAIMARRPRGLGDHPFLFVSSGRTATSGGGDVGDPYTMSAFEHCWQQGVKRIGRQYDDPAMMTPVKWRGTTPHGGRHFYGRFLFTSRVDGRTIRSAMHHRSLYAHLVYTRLTPSEINSLLTDASEGRSSDDSFRSMHDEFVERFRHPPRPGHQRYAAE